MLKSTSRRLTIALAAGALSLFGTAGALAAGPTGTDPGGGSENSPACNDLPLSVCLPGPGEGTTPSSTHPTDEGNPLCSTPLSATPICAAPGGPGEGGGGGDGGGGGGGGR
jgi:hypothetical protein